MRFQTARLRIVDVVAIPLREVVGCEGAEYYDGKIDGRLHEMEEPAEAPFLRSAGLRIAIRR
jgi:hypothetical protein